MEGGEQNPETTAAPAVNETPIPEPEQPVAENAPAEAVPPTTETAQPIDSTPAPNNTSEPVPENKEPEAAPAATTESAPVASEEVKEPVKEQAAAPEPAVVQEEPKGTSHMARSEHKKGGLVAAHFQRISEDHEFAQAKSFLMKSTKDNVNMYDHLTSYIVRILEERPLDIVDTFESLSADIKLQKMRTKYNDNIQAKLLKTPDSVLDTCKSEVKLTLDNIEKEGEKPEMPVIEDAFELYRLLEWAGVGFGTNESYRLFLSIKQLAQEKALKSVRFFGKIFGTSQPYYVVESEVTADTPAPEEPPKEESGEQPAPVKPADRLNPLEGVEDPEVLGIIDTLPKPEPLVPELSSVKLPFEEASGANRYVYWVSNSVTGKWQRLPEVNPNLLQASRRIRKYLTGDLKTKIISYPPFEGTEADYLRSQIARIAASTVISPQGYYTFEHEEGEEENDASSSNAVILNPEYEGHTQEDLLQPSLWMHHVAYILPQGRTTWINPQTLLKKDKEDGEGDNEDDTNEEGAADESGENEAAPLEPEAGPPLLTPIEQELEGGIPSWSIRFASTKIPGKFNPIIVRSNRWPGATTVGYHDKFVNIYVGDGLKEQFQSWKVPPLPSASLEYGIKVEKNEETGNLQHTFPTNIQELADPTLEEEKAFEESKREKEEEEKEAAEAAQEGEEEDDAEENS